jgi:hypothetical protein
MVIQEHLVVDTAINVLLVEDLGVETGVQKLAGKVIDQQERQKRYKNDYAEDRGRNRAGDP